ncbi:hypothetical protein [Paenibacillus sp. HGF7]|uniref:hypothetical protein n=1 Tax=Paenibacillus sp. HGF7 TaxID=944559 RepID=UPI00056A5900|nr:hypothetical protein [Paenibacillus sp. HGF7]
MSTPITLEYLIKNTDQPLINLLDIKDDFRNETPVEDLFVNPGANRETRVINALRRGRICNLENVMNVKFSYIYRLRNMGKVSITVLLNAIFNHYHIESHIPCLKGKSDYQEEYKNIVSTIEPVLLQEISECMFQNLSLEQQRKLLKIIQGRMVLLGEIKMEKNRFDMSLLELIELYKEKSKTFIVLERMYI